jgi:hypothetical protein
VDRWVFCRQQCITPDFSGILMVFIRIPLILEGSFVPAPCPENHTYVPELDDCVAESIATMASFIEALGRKKTCNGGHIIHTAELERLRYCQIITGDLIIETLDPMADYSVLFDITEIQGNCDFLSTTMLSPCPGSLRIINSSMTDLVVFVHLARISGNAPVALEVTGLNLFDAC